MKICIVSHKVIIAPYSCKQVFLYGTLQVYCTWFQQSVLCGGCVEPDCCRKEVHSHSDIVTNWFVFKPVVKALSLLWYFFGCPHFVFCNQVELNKTKGLSFWGNQSARMYDLKTHCERVKVQIYWDHPYRTKLWKHFLSKRFFHDSWTAEKTI